MDKDFNETYKTVAWQRKKARIMERDNWTCRICGSPNKFLNVHHIKYIGNSAADTPDSELITLCEDCHKKVTDGEYSFLDLHLFNGGIDLTPNYLLKHGFRKRNDYYVLEFKYYRLYSGHEEPVLEDGYCSISMYGNFSDICICDCSNFDRAVDDSLNHSPAKLFELFLYSASPDFNHALVEMLI